LVFLGDAGITMRRFLPDRERRATGREPRLSRVPDKPDGSQVSKELTAVRASSNL